jgi:hypothetical protein
MLADDLGEAACGRLLVARRHEEKIDHLTGLIHGARVGGPMAFDRAGRLIHPSAESHRPLAVVERRFGLRALMPDLAVDGRVVDRHAAFLHGSFPLAVAQGIDHRPPQPHAGPPGSRASSRARSPHPGPQREIIPDMAYERTCATKPCVAG